MSGETRTHIDLFSGIGGFALAARWAGVETIAFAEIDGYASRVLTKQFGNVQNYGDVRDVPELDAWLVTGGVPCQPASVAGKRLGASDDRWLWPEALAAVERIRPAWVLFENPTGILSLNHGVEFERICLALEGQSYEVQPIVIPACGVGALHRRNRVWIVAHSERERRRQRGNTPTGRNAQEATLLRETVADTNGKGSQGWVGSELRESSEQQFVGASGAFMADAAESGFSERDRERDQSERQRDAESERGGWWTTEPDVGRVANGVSRRVDRLRGLGNAIVPQVACQLIKRMIESES